MTLNELLTSVADAIRSKTGETALIPAADFSEQILAINSGGAVDTWDMLEDSMSSIPYPETRTQSFTMSKLSAIEHLWLSFDLDDPFSKSHTIIAEAINGNMNITNPTTYPFNVSIEGNVITITALYASSSTCKIKIATLGVAA